MQKFAVGYARLSDRKERSQSIPSQKKDIADYCTRNNLTLLEIFVDDGKSGWTFDRPGFKELEAFCKKNKKVTYLIIPHFDRFSRADPVDAMVKERYFRDRLGVKVLQITEAVDFDTNDAMYQMMRFMQAFTANQERKRTVERVTKNIRYRQLQGRYCATAPFGYINARDERGQSIIVIDEFKADLIRFIYAQFLKGSTIEQIKKAAADKGFTLKSNSAIQRVLSMHVYAGLILVPAYNNQPSKIVPALHEPIIKESDYWKVQEMLSPRKFTPQKRDEVPLRGVIRCQHCGKLMTAAPSRGKLGKYYWYYFCTTHRKENYSAIKVHENLDKILLAISVKEPYYSKLREKMAQAIKTLIDSQTKELMKINLQVSRVKTTITEIERKYLKGDNISEITFLSLVTEKRKELAELESKQESYSLNAADYLNRLDVVMMKAASVRTLYHEFNLVSKQAFIRQIFGNDIVYIPKGFRTPYIHPLFQLNPQILKDLPLIIDNNNQKVSPLSDTVIPVGALTNPLTWEEVKSFIDLFAA